MPHLYAYDFQTHILNALIHGAIYKSINEVTKGHGLLGVLFICALIIGGAYLFVKKPWKNSN